MKELYECIIIGGGVAGLQAAIQLGRYQHDVLVIDSNYGRSTLCKKYHNILGWPDGVSGETLRKLGKEQAESYNVHFLEDKVVEVKSDAEVYKLLTENQKRFKAKTILLATGVMDRIPPITNLKPCLGITIYVCPDCDGYEVKNKHVLLLGAGEAGANLALTLTYWTNEITYINHDGADISESIKDKLVQSGIKYQKNRITEVLMEGRSHFRGVRLQNGEVLYADRAFIGFGGNEVHNELAKQLGVQIMENKHVVINPRTKETNVTNVWAAGDLAAHSEQVTIAMGDGSQAAIWIHKRLLEQYH